MVQTLVKQRALVDGGVVTANEFVAWKERTIQSLQGRPLAESPVDFMLAIVPLLEDGTLSESECASLKRIIFGESEADDW